MVIMIDRSKKRDCEGNLEFACLWKSQEIKYHKTAKWRVVVAYAF